MFVPPLYAFLTLAGLAVSEAVELEVLRTIAITVAAVASVVGAVISARERRELHRFRAEHRRRRREVRDPATETVVVTEQPLPQEAQDGPPTS
jgi:hypothetical protein